MRLTPTLVQLPTGETVRRSLALHASTLLSSRAHPRPNPLSPSPDAADSGNLYSFGFESRLATLSPGPFLTPTLVPNIRNVTLMSGGKAHVALVGE